MLIHDYLSAERGRAAALARVLGVKPVVVSKWASGSKPVPIERCLAIERATEGVVTRKDLRPTDWQAIWPDLTTAQSEPEQEVAHA